MRTVSQDQSLGTRWNPLKGPGGARGSMCDRPLWCPAALWVALSLGVALGAGREGATVFRHDFARRGYDGGAIPLGLKPLWMFRKQHVMVLSSPAVSNGRVYGAGCLLDVFQNCGSIFCLDAQTGRPIWEVEDIGGKELKGIFSSPAITADSKYLVVGEGLHYDRDSGLICLDARTGRLHWRVATPLHVEGSPAIRGNMVVAGAGAIEDAQAGHRPVGDSGFVFAVRISDGKKLWRYALADPESSPAIAEDGTVYIGSGYHGNAVVALRSEADEELENRKLARLVWKTPTPHPATGTVTLSGDLVIVGTGEGGYAQDVSERSGTVMALGRRDGKVRWRTELGGAVLGPVAAGGEVLVCAVRSGHVAALAMDSGKVLWRRQVNGSAPVLAGPALAGSVVYAVSNDGYLAVLSARDGRVIEKHYLNDKEQPGELRLSVSSPTVAGGRVYVGSETGGLRCFTGTGSEAANGPLGKERQCAEPPSSR